jgi:hypothetical protein
LKRFDLHNNVGGIGCAAENRFLCHHEFHFFAICSNLQVEIVIAPK